MDDNCIYTGQIAKPLMAEAMAEADLVLAISPEMQNAYQNEFRQKVWILPPLLDPSLILPPDFRPTLGGAERHGIVVGNIWQQSALDRFCDALIGSGVSVDWYCNTASPGWLKLDRGRLEEAGINFRPPVPEAELVEILRNSPFALLPSSTLVNGDDGDNIGRLSLPSRVPLIAASGGTPIIVLGSPATSAGAFVRHFCVGTVCDYEAEALSAAVEQVTAASFRDECVASAHRLGPAFSATGMGDWVTRGGIQGRAPDARFETLLNYRRDEFGYYVGPPAPDHVFHDFKAAYEALERLKHQGLNPQFILDVGASTGVWSATMAPLFPTAKVVLVDPLLEYYPPDQVEAHLSQIKDAVIVVAAVSDRPGTMAIEVSDNLYGSSLLGIGSGASKAHRIEVPVVTLDQIGKEHGLNANGVLKIDVQFAEHLVIAGGIDLITRAVDAIIIELTLERVHPEMKTMIEVINQLNGLGFRWADQAGDWRSLKDGRLEQIDVVLVREHLLPPLPMIG